MVNQHLNSVIQGQIWLSLFSPVNRSDQTDEMFMSVQSAYAVFVVEHLNQQWIFPTFFIILPPYLSAAFCCSSVALYPPRWAPSVPAGVSDVCLVCISLITVVLHQCTFWPFPHFFVFVVLSRRDIFLMLLLLKKHERQNTHPSPLFEQIAHIWQSCKMCQQIFNISLSVPML